MNIRFVSSLTPDDEDMFAPALLKAIAALLDPLGLPYSLRIETTGAQVLQHMNPAGTLPLGRTAGPAGPRPLAD